MIETAGALLAGFGAIFRTVQFVQEGERGALLRFGKFKRVVEPGFIMVFPLLESLPRLHVRQTTTHLASQTITLKDHLTFQVSAVVVYKVHDVYSALFNIHEVGHAIDSMAMAILREVLAEKKYDEAHHFHEIAEALLAKLKDATKDWGIEFMTFSITDFAPTAETSDLLLSVARAEKQAEGNEIILKHIADNKEEIKKAFGDVPEAIMASLLLRGTHVPSVAVMANGHGAQKAASPVSNGNLEYEEFNG